jgi:hypothetical protein
MRSPRRRTRLSLLARVFLANAAVLAVATLLLLFSPVEISYPVTQSQAILLVTAFLVSLIVNLVVLRGVIAPLRRLATVMPHREAGGLVVVGPSFPTPGHVACMPIPSRCPPPPRRRGSMLVAKRSHDAVSRSLASLEARKSVVIASIGGRASRDDARRHRSPLPARAGAAGERRGDFVQRSPEAEVLLPGEALNTRP